MTKNGHYTTFVRRRDTNDHTPLATVGGASERVDVLATADACTDSETTETTSDDRDHNDTTVDHTLTNDYHLPATQNQNGDQTHTTDHQTTPNNSTTCATNACTVPQTCANNITSNPTTFNFDLSPTAGQWYHISDTHVRTATDTEVHRSQAYLLFYEQLPPKQS